jgi:hypothetical protein
MLAVVDDDDGVLLLILGWIGIGNLVVVDGVVDWKKHGSWTTS